MNYIYPDNYLITTLPQSEPVSISEAKEHLRVTDSNEDTLITSLIKVAREYCESYENRAYVIQTVTANYSSFGEKMFLPVNPVYNAGDSASITSISYIDTSGNTQFLDSSYYELDSYSCPAYVYPAYGMSYPSVRSVPNAVTVEYDAGYVTVPERIKHAIKLILSHLYEHREENSEQVLTEIPFSAKCLLRERVF